MHRSHLSTFQQIMAITTEECGELSQQCMKMVRKHKDEKYVGEAEWISFVEEVGDVFCMIELMVETGLLEWDEIHNRSNVKREKLKKWSTLIKK